MTQGYGNQESAADTKAAKGEPPTKTDATKPAPSSGERKDIATPGDGAGPDETPGGDVDPGVG